MLVTLTTVHLLIVLVCAGKVVVTVALARPLKLVTGGGVIVDVTVVIVGTTIVVTGAVIVLVLETAVEARVVVVHRSGVRFAST